MLLKSGFSSFPINIGIITFTLFGQTYYLNNDVLGDILYYYDNVLYFYDSIVHNCNAISDLQFRCKPSPFTTDLYNYYVSIGNTNIVQVTNLICTNGSSSYFTTFSPIQFKTALLYLHANIENSIIFYNMLMAVCSFMGLILAVNIHSIVAFFSRILDIFAHFFSSMIRKCSS